MNGTAFYRAMWRWHFYAGLIVLPVLGLMAVTGALYLYKPEIERAVYADRIVVTPEAAHLPPSRIVAAVERLSRGRVTQLVRPSAPNESWRMTVKGGNGAPVLWFVNPYDARVLGTLQGGGVMKIVRDLHSLIIAGPVANRLVEVVAGWAILLCLTGLYLRWPRGGSPALSVRGSPRGRLFWRDLHGTLGFLSAGVILFLGVTGMPWTDVWGGGLRAVVAAKELGRPKMGQIPWDAPAKDALPWTLREGGAAAGGSGGVGIEAVLDIAAARGVTGGLTLVLPADPGAPYLVATTVVRASDARALLIDAGSGAVVQDMDWRMFGPGAKAVEWGIATHQGQQYGEVNRLVMLGGCLCLLALCVTAPILWWKRRIGGRLSQPPVATPTARRGVAALMLGVGMLFPLTGLSMVAALAGEWVWGRLRRGPA
ncbi:MAG: PepSY domain-containing protein [Sphingobium sp.]